LQYIPKVLFDEMTSRAGRYPPIRDGGPSWFGVLADCNAPSEDHWLAIMREMVPFPVNMSEDEKASHTWPESWGWYQQPPGLLEVRNNAGVVTGYDDNPAAENIRWLPRDREGRSYYGGLIQGKNRPWIQSRILNEVATVVDGSPVWPMFRTEVHVAREALRVAPRHPVTVGLDFGRQPAAIFMQLVNNRIFVQYELLGQNEGAQSFAPKVRRFLAQHYPDHDIASDVHLYGDPKGQDRMQTDDRTAYDIFAFNNLRVRAAPNLKQNMIATRVDAVGKVLNEMVEGQPRFVLSPLCRTLKVAMAGRYHLVKEESGELKPNKDGYSNPADALQYGVLGLGEGRAMIGLGPIGELRGIQTYKRKQTMRRLEA
jgi:hypothetical protein